MITFTLHFNAKPTDVYSALMDEKKHSAFTGAKAKIENKIGGNFSVWDGYAEGKNLELIPGKKIVQTWRASDWPAGTVSTVTFEFKQDKNGTKLVFAHEGVPTAFKDDIKQGWEEYYWKPLAQFLIKRK